MHKAQLAMELDTARKEDHKIANKIMQHKPVTSIQHFIAGGADENAAVIIWNDSNPVKKIIGQWEFHHAVDEGFFYTNYFRFTPKCNVKSFALETIDEDKDEHYLYYTYNDYKKL